MRNDVLKLAALDGISGRESAVRSYLAEQLKAAKSVQKMRTDAMGNLIVELRGAQRAPHRVLFAAHMDEVGGMVTGITDDGYVRFATVGGIVPEVVFSHRVSINGHVGVIGGKAVHQCQGDEKKSVPPMERLLVDIGAQNREEAEAAVRIGDAVVFADGVAALGNTRYAAKALDDRAGCALLLRLAQTEPLYDVTLAFTVQEEIGLRGAGCAAFAVQPEYAVAIDATTAADVMGTPTEKRACYIGRGGVVPFMDNRTVYDKALFDEIFRIAEEQGIPAQTKTVVAGGNDAGSMQGAGCGARVAAVSVPCRYIHSSACVLDDSDVENTYRLLEALLNRLPAWEAP